MPLFSVTLKDVAEAAREVMSRTSPFEPVTWFVKLKEPAVAVFAVKVAGARLAVMTPERVIPATSVRIPTRSVPSAVLNTMGFANVVFAAVLK